MTNNDMRIKRTIESYGSNQISWREKRFLSKEELNNWVKTRTKIFGSDVDIIGYKFLSDLSDFNSIVIFEEEYLVKNFVFLSGDKIRLFKIPTLNYSGSSVSRQSRKLPYDIGEIGTIELNFEISIPKEYTVMYIPKNLDISFNGGNFTAIYNVVSGKINLKLTTTFKENLIDIKEYSQLKNWIEKRAGFSKEWIMLEKN